MAVTLTNSEKSNKFIKVLIYAESGAGKTPFAATAPKPVFIDSDDGLLSVSHLKIPSLEITEFGDLDEAIKKVKGKKYKNFETVILDDFTEVIEWLLQDLEDELDDKWEVFGTIGKRGKKIIRKFKKIKKNVVIICKIHEIDDDGEILRRPKVAGKLLPEALPFMFDEVFTLMKDKDDETYVLTEKIGSKWYAKDRSRTLKKKEKPDLTYIFNKIKKGKIIR